MSSNFTTSPRSVDTIETIVAGQPLDGTGTGPDQTTWMNLMRDIVIGVENIHCGLGLYTPTRRTNGLTAAPCSILGVYADYGKIGFLALKIEMTGAFTGSGFISVPLPSGWVAQTGVESVLSGYAYPMPIGFGVHYPITGIVHAGGTSGDDEVRFIASNTFTSTVAAGGPGYCTATASTDLFASATAHGLTTGDKVFVKATGTSMPTGVSIGTYYVIASGLTSTAFKLSTSSGGSAVNVTADGNCYVEKAVDITGANQAWFAVDGQNAPFVFTGDGTTANDDVLFVCGSVFKELS